MKLDFKGPAFSLCMMLIFLVIVQIIIGGVFSLGWSTGKSNHSSVLVFIDEDPSYFYFLIYGEIGGAILFFIMFLIEGILNSKKNRTPIIHSTFH